MKTLFDNLWESHIVEEQDEENCLLAIDRIYLHDLCGMYAFQMMDRNQKEIFRKDSVYATPDHTLPSKKGRKITDCEISSAVIPEFRNGCRKYGVTLFDLEDERQGIVHIVGPETGLSLPGMTVVCGDSHTCTHGAIGALSIGVGTSEVYHALATSCLRIKRPKIMKIELSGERKENVSAMDIILYIISKVGIDFGVGYAVEYTGEIVRSMNIDERCTLCNLTIEMGAEYGLVSPDEVTFEYLRGKEYAPKGKKWEEMIRHCKKIATKQDSIFDREISFDISVVERQVSWGINPSQTISIGEAVPKITSDLSEKAAAAYQNACRYMGVKPGQRMKNIPIEYVFIGSCSNGRITYLKQIAEVVKGKKVAENVTAWVVPGSVRVMKEAERLGIDKILTDAGFHWGEPSCSLCVGSNGEVIPYGCRCVSTTNRNFIGRQGRGARTHLTGPYTAALAAIYGKIV